MSAVGIGDDDDLGESDFESDISVDSLDSDSESDSQEEISDNEENTETEEEAGAKPMVRGPWLPVLDTDSFDLGNSIDFAEECGPVNPPDYHAPPICYFNQQLRGGDGGVDLFDLLVRETNRYAEQYLQGRTLSPQSRARAWRPVDREEMRAFLGLLLAMGVVRMPTIASYWNEGDKNWLASTPSFGGIMPRNRFQVIMRFLHCNDNSVAVPRGQPDHDPLHKIRPVLDLVNGSFANSHGLAQSVCVDERMVGFKGRHHLVQYMANKKAHRWGVKLWILAEAGTGYTHQVRIYKGRNLGGPPPKEGLGHSVVMDLMEPHLDKGHHIICDNYFSSPSLCHALFDRGTFCTGVVAVRRKGMPSSFVGKRPPRGSTIVRRQGPLLAVLFSDRKVFTILSTMGSPRMEDGLNSRGRSVTLPSVVRLYNTLMGGVDLGDQLIGVYDPQVRSVKLWKKVLINFLLTASVNAYQTFLNTHGRTTSRLDFHMSLLHSLVGNTQVKRRTGRPRTQPPSRRLTGCHFIEVLPEGKRKQCVLCRKRQRAIDGSAGKVRTWCPDCHVGLCARCFRQYHTADHIEE
ncbi:piggyBac transposable element-derived protein 3-like [Haliotis rufescens]|uniref:piggyBac transposable element-derived protein 3-like n=1 Tax=Haliotis rufescens TaxID=6454 RepID=UPI00201EA484|nr:piggyBac transposable element-derived protein 3-like [Haliotis rufescens]